MAFQNWSSSGNPGVLVFKNWLKNTLAMIVQAAKAYLETEHETTFRFNPQTFIDKMSKSTDVYSPIEQVLLQVWKCSVSVVLHSSSSNLLFHELYLRREKTQRTLREELRKHNPDSNRTEYMPRQEAVAACCTNPFLLLFRFGANISGRNSYHYSHVTQSE